MRFFYAFFTLILFGAVTKTFAQERFTCGHDQYMHQLWAENPEMETQYRQLFQNAKHVVNDGFESKTIYEIPVVFHILHLGGNENISDAQVYDQMEVLNRDYALENADIANAVAGFDTIAGKAEIRFKLAAIDPWGNCTNGINHIYTHETKKGDSYSKINQWPRAHYLNVWVVKAIDNGNGGGTAGYSQYPTAVDGANFFLDGVVILHGYIGRIGTGQEYNSRALTHEIGHWLGLPHVWGDTNEPGVACGDDGVEDTPITKGFQLFCPTTLAQASVCDPNIVENYQNYMDYSYCSIMFTKGQVSLMRNFLQSTSGSRSTLVTDSTHHLTGIDLPTVPQCAPVAEFIAAKSDGIACVGKAVAFTDISWNGVVDSRTWTFEDGNATTTTGATTNVTFTSPGWKTVKLEVSNAAGTDTKEIEQAIYVYPDWSEVSKPRTFDMESDSRYMFQPYNPEPETPGFEIDWSNGVNNSTCYALKYHKEFDNIVPFSNDYFYKNRRGDAEDYLYVPSLGLKYITSAKLTFDYAYATEAFSEADIKEQLIVETSTNCGQTWVPRKTIKTTELLTGGNASDRDFVPTATQWKNASVAINSNQSQTLVRIKFISSDLSNNLYIDNVKLEGVLVVEDPEFASLDVNVYPNPTNTADGIFVSYNANNNDVELELTDMSGKVLSSEVLTTKNTSVTHKIQTPSALNAGVYFVRISQQGKQMTQKVIIL